MNTRVVVVNGNGKWSEGFDSLDDLSDCLKATVVMSGPTEFTRLQKRIE